MLKQITQSLKLLRRADRRKREVQLCGELDAAALRGDSATVHVLSKKLGGAGFGVKRRNYKLPPAAQATLEEWRNELSKPGGRGRHVSTVC